MTSYLVCLEGHPSSDHGLDIVKARHVHRGDTTERVAAAVRVGALRALLIVARWLLLSPAPLPQAPVPELHGLEGPEDSEKH